MKNIRWKVITVIGVFAVFFALGVYPILANRYSLPAPAWLKAKQLKLGLDLKRRRAPRAARPHRRGAADLDHHDRRAAAGGAEPPAINVTSDRHGDVADHVPVEGVPQDQDAEFRASPTRSPARTTTATSAPAAPTTSRCGRTSRSDMREQTVDQARETIDRRVNELGVTEPNISQQGDTGDQLLVQLPGVTDVARAKEIIRSTARSRAEARRSRAGVDRGRRCCSSTAASCPTTWRSSPGAADAGRDRRRRTTWSARCRRHRPATCATRSRRSTRTTARRSLFSLNREGAASSARSPARTSAASWRSSSTTASVGAADRVAHHRRRPDLRQLHAGGRRPVADPALRRAAGVDELSRGARHRPDARRRLDPRRASSRRSPASCWSSCSCWSTTSCRASTRSSRWSCNLIILLGLMAYFGATMTLPGIAGFILTMGMGVDSNVLIFERIKEELRGAARRPRGGQRRLQPRVPDAARHARHVAHRRGVPVPVRHRPDPRLRDDAVDRPADEPVHVDLRVEDAVRAGAARASRRKATLSI